MRKENPNIRALKLLHSFCPSYFPLLVLKSFFGKLSPYFNLVKIFNFKSKEKGLQASKGKKFFIYKKKGKQFLMDEGI